MASDLPVQETPGVILKECTFSGGGVDRSAAAQPVVFRDCVFSGVDIGDNEAE